MGLPIAGLPSGAQSRAQSSASLRSWPGSLYSALMTELAKCTWPEAQGLFGPRCVALLPIGSTEPHGPHLPLDTDVTIALAQARRAAERLEAEGVPTLVLPPIPYGVTRFTQGFKGRVTLRPGTLWSLVEDVAESLAQDGVRRLVLVNGHLEQEHVKVLRGVLLDFGSGAPDKAHVLFADVTRRRWVPSLGEEFAGGDCHAGRYESSLVLAADPASVREDERVKLPPLRIGLMEGMRAGATSFRELGANAAYCGAPAEATAAEGRDLVERLAEVVVSTVREGWPELFEQPDRS
jgi:creatinine amidohydrolase